MTDLSHLNALRLRLSNERGYFAAAKTDGEMALRGVWIAQIEKEIDGELAFLAARGHVEPVVDDLSDDELLAALLA